MKIKYFFTMTIFFMIIGLSNSCKKHDDTPTAISGVTTNPVSDITLNTAVTGGSVSAKGESLIDSRGVCWDTISNPTTDKSRTSNGTGAGRFTSNLKGLEPGTRYFVRAYATAGSDTKYGSEMVFNTKVADVQGNIYNTVTIGNQTWMAENLKATRFQNGDSIPTTITDLSGESNPRYQWAYGNNTANVNVYGRLYTWFVASDTRNVCPVGWIVPTPVNWEILKENLGGEDNAGGKLKETDTVHWASPNTGANNESGFTALAAGYRETQGNFVSMRLSAYFWSSESYIWDNQTWGLGQHIFYSKSNMVWGKFYQKYGKSIRCIKTSQ